MMISNKRMGLFSVIFLLLMPWLLPDAPAVKPDTLPVIEPCQSENNAFAIGEEIVYKLYYNWNFIWLAAGEVVFRVSDDGDTYHISAHGRTYKSYEWFFKVRDKYDTYIDKETLLPLVSIRDIQEGGYSLYDRVEFDHELGKATSLRGKTRKTAKETTYDIDPCIHDLLSIVYFCRNIPFGKIPSDYRIPIKIFMDKEVWPLSVHYKGKDSGKKVKGQGKFRAIHFIPDVIEGGYYFGEGTNMDIWVSDDENKIPLIIESPVSVGSVKAILKSYKGLRYEMDARIDFDDE